MSDIKVFREEGSSAGHLKRLILRVAIGATGAPGAYAQQWGFGTTPLARTGAGVYTVSLGGRFTANALFGYSAKIVEATVTAGDGLTGVITGEAYSTAAAPTVTLTMISTNTGVAAEIPSGASLLLELVFKDTGAAF